MSDIDRLTRNLQKLAAPIEPTRQPGRTVLATGEHGVLRSVLQEIDATILGREIVFQIDAGTALVIEAANRRLLRLKAPDVDPATIPDRLIGQPILESDTVLLDKLRCLLADFARSADKVFVETSRLGRTIDPGEVGCSAVSLAAKWGIDLGNGAKINPADRFENFVLACGDISLASVVIAGDAAARQTGPADGILRLADLVAHDLGPMQQKIDGCLTAAEMADQLTVVGDRHSPEVVVYAVAGDVRAYFIVPSDSIRDIHAAWMQTIVSGGTG